MADSSLRLEGVYKKFRKGEMYDSLRDIVPALGKRLLRRGPPPQTLTPREFWALQDVTFDVHRGEAFGITVQRGGKSTILKLIRHPPDARHGPGDGRVSASSRSAPVSSDLTGRETSISMARSWG